jgi:hypothetical protein
MSKIYAKLKDKGTTFYDASQGKGVVADRVGEFKNSALVSKAINSGILIKLDDAEGAAAYKKQQSALQTQEATVKASKAKAAPKATAAEIAAAKAQLEQEEEERKAKEIEEEELKALAPEYKSLFGEDPKVDATSAEIKEAINTKKGSGATGGVNLNID